MPADTMRQNGCAVLVLHIGQQCWWVFAYACVYMYISIWPLRWQWRLVARSKGKVRRKSKDLNCSWCCKLWFNRCYNSHARMYRIDCVLYLVSSLRQLFGLLHYRRGARSLYPAAMCCKVSQVVLFFLTNVHNSEFDGFLERQRRIVVLGGA